MPDTRLTLVTGGAKRIGAAICLELARHGHDIVIHCNTSMDEAEKLATRIRPMEAKVHIVESDLSDPEQAEDLLEQASEAAGRPTTHLVHNASTFPAVSLADATYDDLDRVMRIHAWAGIALTRSLAKQGGTSAVHMLDTRISSHDPQHVPYLLSKQALANAIPMLAKELAPLRVNGVAPGPILPPTDGSSDTDAALQAGVDATVLGRAGTPEEVAAAVRFMLEAPYTTGEILFVDGGRHLQG